MNLPPSFSLVRGLDGESLFYCLDDLPTAGVAGNTRRGIVSVRFCERVCVWRGVIVCFCDSSLVGVWVGYK